ARAFTHGAADARLSTGGALGKRSPPAAHASAAFAFGGGDGDAVARTGSSVASASGRIGAVSATARYGFGRRVSHLGGRDGHDQRGAVRQDFRRLQPSGASREFAFGTR